MVNLDELAQFLHNHFPEECPCWLCSEHRHQIREIKHKYRLA
jgi:hypothetical protein